ncbi:hypothetical protein VTN77DRAFT_5509 [Rasamsonia byssochlamydoides]|uniref:uncharacterized protein n=1 Tax=Rasamsonia byssochlamydoides TaxID=89139 RepID=UPI003743AFAA
MPPKSMFMQRPRKDRLKETDKEPRTPGGDKGIQGDMMMGNISSGVTGPETPINMEVVQGQSLTGMDPATVTDPMTPSGPQVGTPTSLPALIKATPVKRMNLADVIIYQNKRFKDLDEVLKFFEQRISESDKELRLLSEEELLKHFLGKDDIGFVAALDSQKLLKRMPGMVYEIQDAELGVLLHGLVLALRRRYGLPDELGAGQDPVQLRLSTSQVN